MKQNYSALLKVLYYSTYLKVLYCRYIVGNRDKKHGKRMLDKVIKTENQESRENEIFSLYHLGLKYKFLKNNASLMRENLTLSEQIL